MAIKMKRIINWIKGNRNSIIDLILIISAFLSIWSYLRIIPIIIFSLNILTFKRHLVVSFIFLSIAIVLNIFSLFYNPILESDFKDAMRKGFHKEWEAESRKDLNSLALNINIYKIKHGYFPKSLKDVQKNSMIKDVSYNTVDGCFENPYFYYELLDSNKFYLAAIGQDGLPKTDDDILPDK